MGSEAVKSVLENSKAKGSERVVLFVLAWYARDEDFSAFPSIARLADEANLDRSNVFRILDKLEAKGEIKRTSGKGRHQLNVYKITLPRVKKKQIEIKTSKQTGSKFSKEQIELAVKYMQEERGNIKSVPAYVNSLLKSGNGDEEIEKILRSIAEEKKKRKLYAIDRLRFSASRLTALIYLGKEPDKTVIQSVVNTACPSDRFLPLDYTLVVEMLEAKIKQETGELSSKLKSITERYAKAISEISTIN